ncbi:protein-tyrosine-phosphatase [Bacillus sp. M6-12]|uniref:tyrosine-protein phosphatase n=1 Tax=Bacillus sp. M6-12 TaxID=2054166 RepID=UPI000C785276|nr:tyrosine-protein phosphatase [Bacillus sp. M6-12]PLS18014.1 protein-tyrosine-phosphatase [Bacillus sp. M6-12]
MKNFTQKQEYEFDGLYNFRDIGGFTTESGLKMKKGVLFRSDELSRLSKADLQRFSELGIKLICDLRTSQEQKSKPSRIGLYQNVLVKNISIHDKSQEFTRFEFFKFLVGRSGNIDFEQIMRAIYANMANNCSQQIQEIIMLLSDEENLPALIHCTGGKDRTGFIAALIQLLAGVPYQTVLDEYLFSNELIGPRMRKVERFVRWVSLFQISPDRLKPILEVRHEYLDDIFMDILKSHGSIETYLCQFCNISEEMLASFRNLLLEK